MRSEFAALGLALIFSAAPGSAGEPVVFPDVADARVERARWLMGTRCHVVVERVRGGAEHEAVGAAVGALDAIARVEARLSSWSGESEVATLNEAAGTGPRRVSPELARDLALARAHSRATGGAFDPLVGALIDAWDLRGEGSVPTPEQLRRARRVSGSHGLTLCGRRVAIRDVEAWLDFGAIGKGLALDAVRRLWHDLGVVDGLVDFGGQVLVVGPRAGESARLGVASPSDRSRVAFRVLLRDASIATSSQSERFIEVDGRRYGHVVDPRTGWPVPGVRSVSVVSGSSAEADALATALLVMGLEEGARWLEGRPNLAAACLVESPGGAPTVWATPAFVDLIVSDSTLRVLPWTRSSSSRGEVRGVESS